MENKFNTKLKKQQERELLDEYHKLVTEQALALYGAIVSIFHRMETREFDIFRTY
jgi:hypothetical protein